MAEVAFQPNKMHEKMDPNKHTLALRTLCFKEVVKKQCKSDVIHPHLRKKDSIRMFLALLGDYELNEEMKKLIFS